MKKYEDLKERKINCATSALLSTFGGKAGLGG
jgi:hypothetical protein